MAVSRIAMIDIGVALKRGATDLKRWHNPVPNRRSTDYAYQRLD